MIETLRLPRGPATYAAVVGVLSLLLVLSTAGAASAAAVQRLEAQDNVTASIAWSAFTFAPGATDTALLARDDVFADSLASGAAQGSLDGPLLLTPSASLDPRTAAELDRLGVQHVVILGGTNAIAPAVESELQALGYETERHSGITRIETAVSIAEALFTDPAQVIIARAYGDGEDPTRAFADTLATGNFAAATNIPVLLTETGRLSPATRSYLESTPVLGVSIAGGTEAVSDTVLGEIEAILQQREGALGVTRLSGENRFATAVGMAQGGGIASAAAADRVLLIEGSDPHAWASGFAAAIQSGGGFVPLVLADGDALAPETAQYLDDAAGAIPLVCGPWVSTAACDAAADAMGNA